VHVDILIIRLTAHQHKNKKATSDEVMRSVSHVHLQL